MTTTFERTTVEVRVASSEPPIVAPPKANGPAAAAILAAGIGCFALGLLVILSEAIWLTPGAARPYRLTPSTWRP